MILRTVPAAVSRRTKAIGLTGGALGLLAPFAFMATADAMPTANPVDVTRITRAGAYTQIVPNGICSVDVTVAGAPGGQAISAGADDDNPDPDELPTGAAGAGARIKAHLPVGAGELLTGVVGAKAGAPGGPGGSGTHPGGRGGGFSELVFGTTSLLLAGGGGGTGGGHNGSAGGGGSAGHEGSGTAVTGGRVYNGEDGQAGVDRDNSDPQNITVGAPGGGKAGTAAAGGAGGVHPIKPANSGFPGASREGGEGGGGDGADQGGGGGAGYFGGGGGATTIGDVSFTPTGGSAVSIVGGGGGGGSSFVSDSSLLGSVSLDENITPGETANDPATVDNAFVEFDWVPCVYDLAAAKSVVGPAVFEDGSPITFKVTITHESGDDMPLGDTVTVKDSYLDGATLMSISGDLDQASVAVGDTVSTDSLDLFKEVTDPADDTKTVKRGLKAGESVTLTYRVIAAGTDPIVNTVETFDASGDPDNNTASASLDPAKPSMSLKKSADTKKVTKVGQKVTYKFKVTNTGNIDLRDIEIQEGEFSGAGTLPTPKCPDVVVAPGDSVTCTTTYKAVKADLTGEDLENTATAAGLTPAGAGVVSNESAAALDTDTPSGFLPAAGSALYPGMLGAGLLAIVAGWLLVRRKQA